MNEDLCISGRCLSGSCCPRDHHFKFFTTHWYDDVILGLQRAAVDGRQEEDCQNDRREGKNEWSKEGTSLLISGDSLCLLFHKIIMTGEGAGGGGGKRGKVERPTDRESVKKGDTGIMMLMMTAEREREKEIRDDDDLLCSQMSLAGRAPVPYHSSAQPLSQSVLSNFNKGEARATGQNREDQGIKLRPGPPQEKSSSSLSSL